MPSKEPTQKLEIRPNLQPAVHFLINNASPFYQSSTQGSDNGATCNKNTRAVQQANKRADDNGDQCDRYRYITIFLAPTNATTQSDKAII
jgi:hypothetical protein